MIDSCECGCGGKPSVVKRFIHGHNRKFKPGIENPMFGKVHPKELRSKISFSNLKGKSDSIRLFSTCSVSRNDYISTTYIYIW